MKKNWVWILVNIIALLPLFTLLVHINFNASGEGPFIAFEMPARFQHFQKNFSPLWFPIHSTGEWAIRFLVASLTITPLCILFGFKKLQRYRKLFGLYCFYYTALHLFFFLVERGFLAIFNELSFILGLVAIIIIFPLGLSSNKWAMQWMNKNWKKLQKMVYMAGVVTILHVVLITHASWIFYAVVLTIGFVLRIPIIRRNISGIRKQNSKVDLNPA